MPYLLQFFMYTVIVYFCIALIMSSYYNSPTIFTINTYDFDIVWKSDDVVSGGLFTSFLYSCIYHHNVKAHFY